MWEAAQRLIRNTGGERKIEIIHLGDHDPSGIDMTRDIQDRLEMFTGYDIAVNRIALTMEQIEEYNPPPNPVKLTDTRSNPYIDKYGEDSWELDALEPKLINELIADRIDELTDAELLEAAGEQQEEEREVLTDIADNL